MSTCFSYERCVKLLPSRFDGIMDLSPSDQFKGLDYIIGISAYHENVRPAVMELAKAGEISYDKQRDLLIFGDNPRTYPGDMNQEYATGIVFDPDINGEDNNVIWYRVTLQGKKLCKSYNYHK